MVNEIKVVVKKVLSNAVVQTITNDLDGLHKIVPGTLEMTRFIPLKNVYIVCDDEGKLKDFIPNILYPEIDDYICGNLLFVAGNFNGDLVSLNDEQIKFILNYISIFEIRE